MLPESAQQVSKLRSQFYHSLAAALEAPVTISKEKSYASTLPRVTWTDDQGRLNYVCLYAHSAPDVLLPDHPMVLRIGVNLGTELSTRVSSDRGRRRYNWTCQFYLTLVSSELSAALPWIVEALGQSSGFDPEALSDLPYILESRESPGGVVSLWTHLALKQMKPPQAAMSAANTI
ncbi:MAG: hypothetical protein WBG38_20700 [Nodosilinea sp.]